MNYTHETVTINIKFNDEVYTLEVNPENLAIKRSAQNNDIQILGLGPATRKGHPGLISMEIKSFFPSYVSPYHKYDRYPEDYINFINRIWETQNKDNKVPKIEIRGLDNPINMPFVIDSFTYEYKGGDLDVGYSLSIKQYVPYGVKKISTQLQGMGSERVTSVNLDTTSQKTYTVVSGDSLWSITRRCCGDGSKWAALYNLNKEVIGSNPSFIKPGQVLILPDDWNSPKLAAAIKKQKTKDTNTSKSKGPQVIKNETDFVEPAKQIDIDAATKLNTATKASSYSNMTKDYTKQPSTPIGWKYGPGAVVGKLFLDAAELLGPNNITPTNTIPKR